MFLYFYPATVPNLLLSEDATANDADESDLEIDPGTITPPTSPLRMQESPTVQEMLSAIGLFIFAYHLKASIEKNDKFAYHSTKKIQKKWQVSFANHVKRKNREK